jgi:hypothetical protein
MEESLGLPLKQRSGDFSSPPKALPLYGDVYPTRIAQTGQTIWIRLDGPRSPERGYREISAGVRGILLSARPRSSPKRSVSRTRRY